MMVRTSNDDGPKLREEKHFQDFYPTLEKDASLPVVINSSKNHRQEENEISYQDESHKVGLRPEAQFKELIFNGKTSREPLIIEPSHSSSRQCKIPISELCAPYNMLTPLERYRKRSKLGINRFKKRTKVQKDNYVPYLTRFREEHNVLLDPNVIKALNKISPLFKNFQILYDMDEQDELYRTHLNLLYSSAKLTELHFETIITILEILWFNFQSELPIPDPPPAPHDQLCSICNQEETPNNNIVFCDRCNIAVHQDCYGIIFIPPGPWLCRSCLQGKSRASSSHCSVCTDVSGPLKQTYCGAWVHVWCAIWISELCFGNWHYLEPVEGLERIPNSRWRLNCIVCKMKGGACIQCCNKNCFVAYHVTCARKAGFFMTPIKTGAIAEMALDSGKLESFCDRHSPRGWPNATSRIPYVREEIVKANSEVTKNKENFDTVIAPHAFSEVLQHVFKVFHVSAKVREPMSFDFCRYWSMKREARQGTPLIDVSFDQIYAYNLLDDHHIQGRLSFIETLANDLSKLKSIAALVTKRTQTSIKLVEAESTLKEATNNHQKYLMKNLLLDKLIETNSFKSVENALKDGDENLKILLKCRSADYENLNSLRSSLETLFDNIEHSATATRLLHHSAIKLKEEFEKLADPKIFSELESLLENDIKSIEQGKQLEPLQVVPDLMEMDELSDVEDLNERETAYLHFLIRTKKRGRPKVVPPPWET
ncbi:hypothetical protein KAFR_0K02120 [Kazachstania africana CBS 2517]|uniref:PHD-type domain-containing protein n=1 Tax=Kazachstania africana (strain ATCC 22294 / BCRC 22015 / CBS 2517 / CECT 1963 / NBRC 1671 / NRRL Y-8276) TaxID=1071382 RepID=H2B1R6_KAZAF|nr:hypothetical protein KAFR_0K02120 [Kazachstania africana CBS 2517]CCF60566.1 hypothetical protein KAFR_0K02120 [Kazachstania africana CBS 2517]